MHAQAIRDRVDLAEVARRLLGDPTGRNGRSSDGRRLWWCCPFHDDKNPSFCVEAGKSHWRCFGCGAHGDAIELARRLRHLSFHEALSFVSGRSVVGSWKPAMKLRTKPRPKPRPVPSADDEARQEAMQRLVEQAQQRLWSTEGRQALDYLRGRGLSDATIRLARLGWASNVPQTRFRGIVIPWLSTEGIERVKIRQPRGIEPRYAEVYHRRPKVYPAHPLASLPDLGDVVVVEGELDALLLGQQLQSLATVITTGSASNRPEESVLRDLDSSLRLFVATDADDAGDRSADWWPKRAQRVRPPAGKDWTEAHLAGFDLRRWWLPLFFGTRVEDFEERAAILEFDGELPRDEAERRSADIFRDPR